VNIEIEGKRGRGYSSDMAIDAIVLNRGYSGPPTPAPPTPPTPAPTPAPPTPLCGPPDSACKGHVDWGFRHGRWSNPEWYAPSLDKICGINGGCRWSIMGRASYNDFQQLFFCGEYGASKKCSMAPCQCTNPPCGACGVTANPPTPPAPSPPAPSPATNPGGGGSQVSAWALDEHNRMRCLHRDTPVLTWSSTLAADASACAQTCPTGHSSCDQNGAGENLYYAGSTVALVEDANSWDNAIQAWYGEEPSWDYVSSTSSDGGVVGHFTQIVWKATSQVGCAMNVNCNNKFNGYKNLVVVCRYSQPGNLMGAEAANVLEDVASGGTASSSCPTR